MDLYNSLMEMVITEDSTVDYIERRNLLEKYNFTREDLSNPNTVKKIYNDFKENKSKKNIYDRFGSGLAIVMFILALPSLGIIPAILSPLLMKLFDLSKEMPIKEKNKAVKDLKEKANKLINKLNKEISNTSDKNAQKKLQKEIDSIKNILKEIDNQENEIANKKKESDLKDYINIYQEAIKLYKSPRYMEVHPQHGDREDFICLYIINNCASIDTFIKRCKNIKNDWGNDDEKIIKINDNLDKNIYLIFYDDNEANEVYYLKNKDLFVISDYDRKIIGKGDSALSSFFKKNSNYISDYDKKMIKEADKELGYYLLSKAPQGIKVKENPFK